MSREFLMSYISPLFGACRHDKRRGFPLLSFGVVPSLLELSPYVLLLHSGLCRPRPYRLFHIASDGPVGGSELARCGSFLHVSGDPHTFVVAEDLNRLLGKPWDIRIGGSCRPLARIGDASRRGRRPAAEAADCVGLGVSAGALPMSWPLSSATVAAVSWVLHFRCWAPLSLFLRRAGIGASSALPTAPVAERVPASDETPQGSPPPTRVRVAAWPLPAQDAAQGNPWPRRSLRQWPRRRCSGCQRFRSSWRLTHRLNSPLMVPRLACLRRGASRRRTCTGRACGPSPGSSSRGVISSLAYFQPPTRRHSFQNGTREPALPMQVRWARPSASP